MITAFPKPYRGLGIMRNGAEEVDVIAITEEEDFVYYLTVRKNGESHWTPLTDIRLLASDLQYADMAELRRQYKLPFRSCPKVE